MCEPYNFEVRVKTALQLTDVTLAYARDQIAVKNLNLEVESGELLALLGPSGCGKTTSMKAVAGLLEPVSGQIRLGNKDITRVPANRRDIGMVFQSYALFPHLSVFENVAFGLRIRRVETKELEERVRLALETVDLAGFHQRLPAQLSGGQQQRVALARAFVIRPQLMLLDEPLSNLDARLRLEMRVEIRRLQKQLGVTMLYVTHDQAEALALADRVAIMNAGRIEQLATPEVIYNQPATVFAARFVGFDNILPVKILENRVQIGRIEQTLSRVVGKNANRAAWRSESIELGGNTWTGKVLTRSFEGQRVEYQLETELGLIRASIESDKAIWKENDTVGFGLPLARAVFLEESNA
jgi:putative spermidine/putrescine transport system ATP-binding protein